MSGRAVRWLMSLAHRPTGFAADRTGRLTIIRHHRVYAATERPLYRLGVSEPVFVEQLSMLVAMGLTPVTVSEGLRRIAENRPGHWVAMSFDDGYADNAERALPHLVAASARATFYLTAGLMEDRRPPWWDVLAHALEQARRDRFEWTADGGRIQLPLRSRADREHALGALLPSFSRPPAERDAGLAELRERLDVVGEAACELMEWGLAETLVSADMEVGAHTLTHPHLSRIPAAAQREEIVGSVDRIAARLGVRPTGLAYPGGDYDATTLEVMAGTGLDHAVTTRAGVVGTATPRFELGRRGLSEGACLGPSGRFSRRLAIAELDGAFDRMRGHEVPA